MANACRTGIFFGIHIDGPITGLDGRGGGGGGAGITTKVLL